MELMDRSLEMLVSLVYGTLERKVPVLALKRISYSVSPCPPLAPPPAVVPCVDGGQLVRWSSLSLLQVVSALNYLKENLNVLHRGEELRPCLSMCVCVRMHGCLCISRVSCCGDTTVVTRFQLCSLCACMTIAASLSVWRGARSLLYQTGKSG